MSFWSEMAKPPEENKIGEISLCGDKLLMLKRFNTTLQNSTTIAKLVVDTASAVLICLEIDTNHYYYVTIDK